MKTIYSHLIEMKNQDGKSYFKTEQIELLQKMRLFFRLFTSGIILSLIILNLHYLFKLSNEMKLIFSIVGYIICTISIMFILKMNKGLKKFNKQIENSEINN